MAEPNRAGMSAGSLTVGGSLTAVGIGYLSQRHPEFLDFSQNVLDLAPLGIIVITIGGALGEGVRRLFRWAARPSSTILQEDHHDAA